MSFDWKAELGGLVSEKLGVDPIVDHTGGGIVPNAAANQYAERTDSAQPSVSQVEPAANMGMSASVKYSVFAVAGLVALVFVFKAVK